jgi:hypothetical protein
MNGGAGDSGLLLLVLLLRGRGMGSGGGRGGFIGVVVADDVVSQAWNGERPRLPLVRGRPLEGGRLRETRLGNCGRGRDEDSRISALLLLLPALPGGVEMEIVGDGCALFSDANESTVNTLGCSLSRFIPGTSFVPCRFPFTPLSQPQDRFRVTKAGG